jgi:phospholipid-binding lipoprotein MlaA
MFKLTVQKMRLAGIVIACLITLFVSGCSVTPQIDPNLPDEAPIHNAEEMLNEGVTYAVDVYDPIEGFNRRTYAFNYYFDKFVFLPIVAVYEFILPDYVEDRVSNFVDNIFEFNNLTNNILQLKADPAGITLGRFILNTTIGVAGLWDPATYLGLERQTEDFGQTLGHYGVGDGPYIVLPILGPSNLRDTTGWVVDTVAFSLFVDEVQSDSMDDNDVALIFSGVAAVDKRHRQSFRYYQTGSPFEYEMIRMLYGSKRQIEIEK